MGVDFFEIGERGDQFGPYGALYPLQLNIKLVEGYSGKQLLNCAYFMVLQFH